jgi:uncharacterized protein (DUF58 family)
VVPGPEDLNRLRNLSLVARWAVEGFIAGLHRSPYHGPSAEFLEYREYTAGEDLRYLDWKVYGRSDRTYIKRFQGETNLRAFVLLDASASMAYAVGGRDKFAYARALSACLIYLFHRQGDAAGLITFGSGTRSFRRARSTPRHRTELFRELEGLKAEGASAIGPVLDETAERLGGRSLVVIISDFYEDPDRLASGFRHLRFKRHEVIAFQVVDPTEERFEFDGMLSLVDLETGARLQVDPAAVREAYVARFNDHMDRIHSVASDALVDHCIIRTDMPFAEALALYLSGRARVRH